MGRGGRAERDSCQWLVERCRLNPHERCRKCVDLDSYAPSEISNKGIQYKGVCLLLTLPAMPSHKEPSTSTLATEPLDQTPTQLFSNPPPYFASPSRKRSTLENGEENKSFWNRILSVVSPRRRKNRGDTVMSTPVKNVIRFSIVSPRKKESQRVSQKLVPN